MHKIKLLFLLNFCLFNATFANENRNIIISDAWISEAPPTVYVLAAYAKIQNLSDKVQTLISVSSPSFSMIELHLSKIVGEVAKMEKQSSLSIPANNSIELTPGAYHLMLYNPKSALKAEDTATLTFTFADGASNTIKVMVKKRDTVTHEHNHDHGHHNHEY